MSAFVFSEDLEVEMKDTIKEIPLGELHPFPDHPFGVRDDEAMAQTVESIKEYGVLVPAIARPRENGGYEIIAGHRRKHACEIAGLKTMPVTAACLRPFGQCSELRGLYGSSTVLCSRSHRNSPYP